MRIGIFGGSFNPIHTGHLMVANYCSQFCNLDRVWLMVSPCNPLKMDKLMAPDASRLMMCQMAAEMCANVAASDFEFNLPKPSFTYRTLCRLREAFPDHEFVLIIGADNWLIFDKWKDYDKILKEFKILVYPRPGYDLSSCNFPKSVSLIEGPEVPIALISSSFVRMVLENNGNVNYFVPPVVADYAIKHQLYGK